MNVFRVTGILTIVAAGFGINETAQAQHNPNFASTESNTSRPAANRTPSMSAAYRNARLGRPPGLSRATSSDGAAANRNENFVRMPTERPQRARTGFGASGAGASRGAAPRRSTPKSFRINRVNSGGAVLE